MPKELVISAAPHETRVAILEDGLLCEIYIEREKEFALVGSIYKGRVTRVLPGMQSAFVEIGLDSDAFLYVGDFLENLEDYDHGAATTEAKVQKPDPTSTTGFAQNLPLSAESPMQAPQPEPPADDEASQPALDGPEPGNEAPRYTQQQPPAQQRQPFARPPAPYGRQERGQGSGQGQGQGSGQGSGGFGGQRSGQGGGGGGRRRGGRWRGGRSGGGSDRPGRSSSGPGGARDLPSAKYASPSSSAPSSRSFTPRPYEPPVEELPADFKPILLPGESLAKYKNLTSTQAQPAVPAAETSSESASAAPVTPAEPQRGLPSSLYASPVRESRRAAPPRQQEEWKTPVFDVEDSAPAAALPTTPVEPTIAETAPSAHVEVPVREAETKPSEPEHTESKPAALQQSQSAHVEPEQSHIEHTEAEPLEAHLESVDFAGKGPELSDDEMTILSEQLAEARQEEATAAADAAATDAEAEADAAHEADHDEQDHESLEHSEHPDHAGHSDHEPEHLSETGQAEEDDEEFAAEAEGAEGEEAAVIEATGAGMEEAVAEGAENAQPDMRDPSGDRPMSARVAEPQRARFQRPMRRGGRPNQNRSQHQRRQPPRRPQLISEMLKANQEIIVQIAKEPLGKKGARITSHVALPGRFLVYMPTVNHIGVSRRISSAEERSRLRRLVTESKGTFPGGFIVRTAADGAPEDEVRADVEFLGRTWEKIRAQTESRKAPALLHRDLNLVERVLRDYVSNDYTAIWIDNEEEFSKVVEFVSRFQPKLVSRVKLYTKPAPIFEEFGIQQELDKALHAKVWLKSGGYIVINHTEALVAIDVNTGKYVGRGSSRLEDTIVKTNLEAVKEIVRQIRLRDLGGIIVLDLIDMEERRNRDKVMAALEVALRADRAPSKALPFNEFGLVNITRKRTKQALERVLCQPCPYCTGSGMVKSVPTICYEIQTEARKMANDLAATSITLRVHPEIAKALKTREAVLIEELEQTSKKSIIIQGDPTLHWEQYDIY